MHVPLRLSVSSSFLSGGRDVDVSDSGLAMVIHDESSNMDIAISHDMLKPKDAPSFGPQLSLAQERKLLRRRDRQQQTESALQRMQRELQDLRLLPPPQDDAAAVTGVLTPLSQSSADESDDGQPVRPSTSSGRPPRARDADISVSAMEGTLDFKHPHPPILPQSVGSGAGCGGGGAAASASEQRLELHAGRPESASPPPPPPLTGMEDSPKPNTLPRDPQAYLAAVANLQAALVTVNTLRSELLLSTAGSPVSCGTADPVAAVDGLDSVRGGSSSRGVPATAAAALAMLNMALDGVKR